MPRGIMSEILIIEDNPNQAELYLDELSDEGHQVRCGRTGEHALALLKERCPDCIILDLNMPGMDGLEVLKCLRVKHPHLPVIVHTAYSISKDELEKWSVAAYITKSSDLDELKQTISYVLQSNNKVN